MVGVMPKVTIILYETGNGGGRRESIWRRRRSMRGGKWRMKIMYQSSQPVINGGSSSNQLKDIESVSMKAVRQLKMA